MIEETTATVLTGSLGLTVSGNATEMVESYRTDPSVRAALKSGIATALEIDSSMIQVTDVSASVIQGDARRLRASPAIAIQIDYIITIPEGSSTPVDAATITSSENALMEGLNRAMEDADLGYQITALDAPEPTTTTVSLTGTTTTQDIIMDLSSLSDASRVHNGMARAALGLVMAASSLMAAP